MSKTQTHKPHEVKLKTLREDYAQHMQKVNEIVQFLVEERREQGSTYDLQSLQTQAKEFYLFSQLPKSTTKSK